MRLVLVFGLAAVLPIVAACGTFGQPSNLTTAERQDRCDARGGVLTAEGRCVDVTRNAALSSATAGAALHRAQMNSAVSRSVRNGY